MRKLLFGMLFAPLAIGSNIALADGPSSSPSTTAWPVSVLGTWSVLSDLTNLVMKITSQGATGNCRAISGTMQGAGSSSVSNLQGFYCPFSGRIHFLRKLPGTNVTFEAYTGNLSQAATACTTCRDFIGGVFSADLSTDLFIGRRPFGEYNWQAFRDTPG